MARILMLAGLLLFLCGLLLWLFPGALSWFGRLPGDIHIEGEQGRVFIPITSMLLLSLVLSLIFSLFR